MTSSILALILSVVALIAIGLMVLGYFVAGRWWKGGAQWAMGILFGIPNSPHWRSFLSACGDSCDGALMKVPATTNPANRQERETVPTWNMSRNRHF